MTDDEVYQLKGGNANLAIKAIFGLGFVFAYLFVSKRMREFTSFSVSGNCYYYNFNKVFLKKFSYNFLIKNSIKFFVLNLFRFIIYNKIQVRLF